MPRSDDTVEIWQSTITIVRRAALLGLFTAAQAAVLIDRVAMRATTAQLSIEDSDTEQAGTVP